MKTETEKKKKKKHRNREWEDVPTSVEVEDGDQSNGFHHGDVTAKRHKIDDKIYVEELARLQIELVKLQEWVKHEGLKVVVLFEGRDAAGKGGVIKRITESLNPAFAGSWPWAPRPSEKRKPGISSAMSPICPPRAKSCSSTAAGTTARAWNG